MLSSKVQSLKCEGRRVRNSPRPTMIPGRQAIRVAFQKETRAVVDMAAADEESLYDNDTSKVRQSILP